MSRSNNVYVVFEGMDGSGKTTLTNAAIKNLPWSAPTRHFVFPSHEGEVGKLVRRVFSGEASLSGGRDEWRDIVLGYLMVADSVDHEPEIRSSLMRGMSVVCDRHATVSGWVYQTERMPVEQVLAIQQRQNFLRPHVFVIDVPEEVAMDRIAARGGTRNSIYERDGIDYVSRLRNRYISYASMHQDVMLLDGTKTTEQLLKDVEGWLASQGALW